MNRDVCVVVPTIREYECMREYFQNARDHGFDLDRLFVVLVTEDFCDTDGMRAMLDEEGVAGAVFDGSDRESWFAEQDIAEYSHLIPAASHAQTSFGLLYLWANDFEYGVFIDDDTLPHDEWDFFGTHLDNLAHEGSVEEVSSDEQWVNVLFQSDSDLYPRGYPYAAMDEDIETDTTETEHVVASQGLWTNVPDLDAVRILMDGDLQGQAQTRTDFADFDRDFVAAEENYLTVCSMNLAFRREVVPAFYQFPMDDNAWEVGRFDDIWSGVLLKRAADVVGGEIYNGAPLCEHNKAPRSTFDDLANEVAGLELNEHFWKEVAAVEPDEDSYEAVARAVGERLVEGDYEEYNNGAFLAECGEYLLDWVDCCAELAEQRAAAPADD
ncbi:MULTISPECIES: alpha-1 4-glucan-protein synthase [Halobacterium]|uniref:alpha-1 4-glucan-protein synthase n=1 Tax=Halobacterium TaxID=2239 RepID=UPI00073E3C48|nr:MULTISPECIES: alpha-1 4-glucan-protein synthase [Halobacterium]MCG1002909.1 alpha-1 4-glucan-protein synthase [Halobacterium noricense]